MRQRGPPVSKTAPPSQGTLVWSLKHGLSLYIYMLGLSGCPGCLLNELPPWGALGFLAQQLGLKRDKREGWALETAQHGGKQSHSDVHAILSLAEVGCPGVGVHLHAAREGKLLPHSSGGACQMKVSLHHQPKGILEQRATSPDLIDAGHRVHHDHLLLGPGHDVGSEDELTKTL